ncbi:COMPASS (complex proteins associated with Set1p) component [Maublancomyces gigas]|uniref:COMPASS (Complex proteins associated with Set1p) component n=1 Tax=Discina gigas TaxID=1032678 RepID=A0ABR3GIC8_9PEZI
MATAPITHPPKQPSPAPLPVNQIPPGGAPARRYLNENITPVLLEGMKMLAREQPKEPLLALARFLEEMHRESNIKLESDMIEVILPES